MLLNVVAGIPVTSEPSMSSADALVIWRNGSRETVRRLCARRQEPLHLKIKSRGSADGLQLPASSPKTSATGWWPWPDLHSSRSRCWGCRWTRSSPEAWSWRSERWICRCSRCRGQKWPRRQCCRRSYSTELQRPTEEKAQLNFVSCNEDFIVKIEQCPWMNQDTSQQKWGA